MRQKSLFNGQQFNIQEVSDGEKSLAEEEINLVDQNEMICSSDDDDEDSGENLDTFGDIEDGEVEKSEPEEGELENSEPEEGEIATLDKKDTKSDNEIFEESHGLLRGRPLQTSNYGKTTDSEWEEDKFKENYHIAYSTYENTKNDEPEDEELIYDLQNDKIDQQRHEKEFEYVDYYRYDESIISRFK